jgi:hypothetical protein
MDKLAYQAYIMPEYSRIEEEEEERRRAARRAWRLYAATSGLVGAGMVALGGNNKTLTNIGRALSASSLAASLGTGGWATAGTTGAMWGLGEWLRTRVPNNRQDNNGNPPQPPQPPQPPTGDNQQNNTNTEKEKEPKHASDLSDTALQKTAARQIKLIQTFQTYYMLKSAQDFQTYKMLKSAQIPVYERYHPGLYYDEYEERRRRRRETRNLFNALTWGGLAANVAARFANTEQARRQLNTIGNWLGWGGILGNTLSGNFGSALTGMTGRWIANRALNRLENIEQQGNGEGILSHGRRLFERASNWFRNLFNNDNNNNNNGGGGGGGGQ